MMKKYGFIIVAAVLVILIILFIPRGNNFKYSAEDMLSKIQNRTYIVSQSKFKELNAKTAFPLALIDLRDGDAYREGHLPGAIQLPDENPNGKSLNKFMKSLEGQVYLYSDQTAHACEWWILLTQIGFEEVFVLETGSNLSGLIKDWEGQNIIQIMPDEIPRYHFVPDSSNVDQ